MSGFATSNAGRWLSRNAVKLAWVIAGLCLLMVVINVTWHLRSNYITKKTNYAPQEQVRLSANTGPNYRINDVVRANLFGDPSPAPIAKKAPKTTLNLTLQGVLWATDNGLARAIISEGKKTSKLYSVGEKISGANASVKEIRNNEVILDRNGASESLPIVKLKGSDGIIAYTSNEGSLSKASYTPPTLPTPNTTNFRRASSADSTATSNKQRKVRKPNFSGLDRALRKAGEI